MTVSILWLFLIVLWVGLQCVVDVFLGHTNLLLQMLYRNLLAVFHIIMKIHFTIFNYITCIYRVYLLDNLSKG